MKECIVPHTSEHCPHSIPKWTMLIATAFALPGMASVVSEALIMVTLVDLIRSTVVRESYSCGGDWCGGAKGRGSGAETHTRRKRPHNGGLPTHPQCRSRSERLGPKALQRTLSHFNAVLSKLPTITGGSRILSAKQLYPIHCALS